MSVGGNYNPTHEFKYQGPDGVKSTFPADTWSMDRIEPVYESLPGWQSDTTGARSLSELPDAARRYLDRIQELMGTPIEMVSVGTRRAQIIRVA